MKRRTHTRYTCTRRTHRQTQTPTTRVWQMCLIHWVLSKENVSSWSTGSEQEMKLDKWDLSNRSWLCTCESICYVVVRSPPLYIFYDMSILKTHTHTRQDSLETLYLKHLKPKIGLSMQRRGFCFDHIWPYLHIQGQMKENIWSIVWAFIFIFDGIGRFGLSTTRKCEHLN